MPARETRREFLKQAAVLATSMAGLGRTPGASPANIEHSSSHVPWYRRTVRWGQTNITEIDPQRYDIAWWRRYWRRTRTQGVILNAGGIVAYYPSRVPLHHQAAYLNGRDLFGELRQAAHEDGLAVFARMDSSKAHEDFFQAHPDWFARDRAGRAYRSGELFVACVNSPYYTEHIPAILRELIDRYHPEGFTDNSWSGLGRSSPCFCENCQGLFRARTGQAIPLEKDWDNTLYRQWVEWNYQRRLEVWDFNNRVTRTTGGPDCLWVGMNSGSITGQAESFRDYREICRRAEIIMLDHQARSDATGFQNNGQTGKRVHGMLGWDKLIPESMAMYQAGRPTFRLTSKPAAEAQLWMLEGIAGGLQPWWHHIGAYHEDRRMYHTAEPVCRWHEANQQYLLNRQPIATVGVVWSQRNTDFYGRDDAELLVELPWRGLTQALIRARIPYLPVHADDLEREATRFSLLVLPNLAAMSDAQVAAVRQFVAEGGNLLASGQTSLFNELGQARPDFALADLFGAHITSGRQFQSELARRRLAAETAHSYLRLLPELRSRVDGPHITAEPRSSGTRHPVLRGFEETDLLPFGGVLEPLAIAPGAQVLMTYVPPFPMYPPEKSWMRQPKTDIPGLLIQNRRQGGRTVFLPADLDRRYGRDNLPDHVNLLANLVRWAVGDNLPVVIEGPGLIDCHLYHQPGRVIVHLLNLTNPGAWRQPVDELIPVGPVSVRVKLPEEVGGKEVRSLVTGKTARAAVSKGWSRFEVSSILMHEVLVLS